MVKQEKQTNKTPKLTEAPTTTAAPSSFTAPTSTAALTSTAEPTSTAAQTTTAAPPTTAAPTTTTSDKGNVVLITGGAKGREGLKSSEIYNPVTKAGCSLPHFTDARGTHSQDGGLTCGGGYPSPVKNCVKWNPVSGTWNQSHTLKETRVGHVSWATPSGVYLIGGDKNQLTSEKVKMDGSVEQGFSLKYAANYACAIPNSDNEVIITGGNPTMKTVSVYSEAGLQRDLANLNKGRHLHACTSYVNGGKMVCFHL